MSPIKKTPSIYIGGDFELPLGFLPGRTLKPGSVRDIPSGARITVLEDGESVELTYPGSCLNPATSRVLRREGINLEPGKLGGLIRWKEK